MTNPADGLSLPPIVVPDCFAYDGDMDYEAVRAFHRAEWARFGTTPGLGCRLAGEGVRTVLVADSKGVR